MAHYHLKTTRSLRDIELYSSKFELVAKEFKIIFVNFIKLFDFRVIQQTEIFTDQIFFFES